MMRERARALRTASLVATALVVSACGEPPPQNVLLVTIDTLRADRLGAFGYTRPTSPGIDRLAAQSAVFDAARSSSSWTLPSLASLLTSTYTSTHRCWDFRSRLAESFLTLPEWLHQQGFVTAGIGTHVFLGARYGLQQGFDHYDDEMVLTGLGQSHKAITSKRVTDRALVWISERDPGERWFMWAHYFDPHELYRKHAGISEQFGTKRKSDLYDGEIAFTDREIGRLIEGVDRLGLADRTLVILTADHGEEFKDHGETLHGHQLYDELVHVPLMMRGPGIRPRRIEDTVSVIDVFPTVAELLGQPAPEDVQGRSLVPLLEGGSLPPRPVLMELQLGAKMNSVEQEGWKLIRRYGPKRIELFDRTSDPGEHVNLASEHPERVEELLTLLKRSVRTARAQRVVPRHERRHDLTPEDVEALRELGYLDPSTDP